MRVVSILAKIRFLPLIELMKVFITQRNAKPSKSLDQSSPMRKILYSTPNHRKTQGHQQAKDPPISQILLTNHCAAQVQPMLTLMIVIN